MPPFRLTEHLINGALAVDHQYPQDGALPTLSATPVRDESGQVVNVPIVVAHTFIAGSGPIGCSFARVLLERPTNRPSIAIAEIGSQEGAIKGRNLKNSLKYQKDIDAFVHVIQGHLQPISVVPTHPVLSMYGNNPNQERSTNLPASAVTRTVGGMATHWTCCCPLPHQEEKSKSPIPAAELDTLLRRAGEFLKVNSTVFNGSIRHTIVKKALAKALPEWRGLGNLPLGVQPPVSSRNYPTWTGSDTVLDQIADQMFWMTETRVTRLVWAPGNIRAAVVRDYNIDSDVLVIAKSFVIASGAIGTPQILHNSGIRPPALGKYLSEQSIAFCQIVLRRPIIRSVHDISEQEIPGVKERIIKHQKSHPGDVIPIPFDDLEPQVLIPYHTDKPWHVQIHRDAFSYGDIGPTADPRIIVDLRFFGKSDLVEQNRVQFPTPSVELGAEWTGGDTDIYGMPQATFWVTRTQADEERDKRMMEDMKVVAQSLGEYLPAAQPQFMPPGLALHITGTTRMQSRDTPPDQVEAVSVVDTNSKVHGYNNLWLGGCNVIPDSMACNPTRTAMAYSIRAAEAIHKFLYP